MKKIFFIFSIFLVLFTSCKTTDKKEETDINENFVGNLDVVTEPMQIGQTYNLKYDSTPITGSLKINGPWVSAMSNFILKMTYGEKPFTGNIKMTNYFKTLKFELVYDEAPVIAEFQRDYLNSGNWTVSIRVNEHYAIGNIKQFYNVSNINLKFADEKIIGERAKKYSKYSFNYKFGDKNLKGNIVDTFKNTSYTFETDKLTEDEVIIFLVIDFLRVLEIEYEKYATSIELL
jgi:hypothetical protein